jgi:hypothetical protein
MMKTFKARALILTRHSLETMPNRGLDVIEGEGTYAPAVQSLNRLSNILTTFMHSTRALPPQAANRQR